MDLFIDNTPADSDFAMEGSIESALKHLQDNLRPSGRMVVGLRCDGTEVPSGEMAATLQKPAASFDRLDVSTSTRGELVAEAMSQASTALLQTETEIQRIADLLTEGKNGEGMPALGKCMSVWQQMNDAVNKSIQILELDAQKMLIGDEAMADILAKPMEVLLQVKQALESKDYVLLADTLQYEFGDVTQQWHSVIAEIRREAERLLAGTADPT